MKNLKEIYHNNWVLFPQLVALLIPFGVNSAIVVVFWLISFFVCYDVSSALKRLVLNKWLYVFLSFFIIHAIGYFFSVNKTEALSAIEIKMSFIAFPLLIFSHTSLPQNSIKILVTFVSSCFLACLFCLFYSLYLYFFNNISAFYYSDFSVFLHPSYFSMYLLFALSIVWLFYNKWLSHLQHLKSKIIFLSSVFILCIFLSASKIGLAAFFILLLVFLSIYLVQKGQSKWIALAFVSVFVVLFMAYKFDIGPMARIKVAFSVTNSNHVIDKTATESTAVRLLIWEQAANIINKHLAFGISPGDTNDALYQAYQQNGLTGAYDKKLNAHNQYFQTFIGTGIIGFLLLSLISIGLIVIGIIKKNNLLAVFGFIITLNFVVESMLQTQAGVIFFVFFCCLLLNNNLSKSIVTNS